MCIILFYVDLFVLKMFNILLATLSFVSFVDIGNGVLFHFQRALLYQNLDPILYFHLKRMSLNFLYDGFSIMECIEQQCYMIL